MSFALGSSIPQRRGDEKNLPTAARRWIASTATMSRDTREFQYSPQHPLRRDTRAFQYFHSTLCAETRESFNTPHSTLCAETRESFNTPHSTLCTETRESFNTPTAPSAQRHERVSILPTHPLRRDTREFQYSHNTLCAETRESFNTPHSTLCTETRDSFNTPHSTLCAETRERFNTPHSTLCKHRSRTIPMLQILELKLTVFGSKLNIARSFFSLVTEMLTRWPCFPEEQRIQAADTSYKDGTFTRSGSFVPGRPTCTAMHQTSSRPSHSTHQPVQDVYIGVMNVSPNVPRYVAFINCVVTNWVDDDI